MVRSNCRVGEMTIMPSLLRTQGFDKETITHQVDNTEMCDEVL